MEIKEKVGTFGRFNIWMGINTEDPDRAKDSETWKGDDFIAACERVKKILGQLEEHEDFESLLRYKQTFEKIARIVNDTQADDCNDVYQLKKDMGEVPEDDCCWEDEDD